MKYMTAFLYIVYLMAKHDLNCRNIVREYFEKINYKSCRSRTYYIHSVVQFQIKIINKPLQSVKS